MSGLTLHLSGIDHAACGDLEVKCLKSPITKLARKLVAAGHDFCEPVCVMRGDVQAFRTAPLWKFASVVASEPASGSGKLAKYKADPRFASQAPTNASGGGE